MPRSTKPVDAARRALLAVPLVLAAAPAGAAPEATLRGTVTYRERMALPPGAVLEVALSAETQPGTPAREIAALRQRVDGQVPIPFMLAYAPERIPPGARRLLRAALWIGQQRAFVTLQPHVVPDGDAPVELLLARDAAGERQQVADPAHALADRRWVATEIGGAPVAAGVTSDITFTTAGQVHGSGGCNRIAGGYRLEGADGIRIGPLAGTMMACEDPKDAQERRFHEALGAARHWRITDGTLLLRDAGGATVARLRPG
ncbi:MAG: META domain-containing protein [Acetobacteraceae bacterium]|nr:META domain-containing protein [Acetobacteraceae bacterium]